jgi:hypothetical protein
LARKKGEEYKCDECGLVVLVENPCECGDDCVITCCEQPMKQVKASTKSTSSKAPVKATEKPKK